MTKLLTEIANYDEPGSWDRMSKGWPSIKGDDAYAMYVFANCAPSIPYGSYVLIDEAGKYGSTKSHLRVHSKHIAQLLVDFESAGRPNAAESVRRRGAWPKRKADKWW